MDKQYQDLHVRIEDEEVFTLRCIELLEFVKRPKSMLFRYRAGSIREQELLVPIVCHMAIIID